MAPEGLGRQAVELREPGCAACGRLVVTHAGEDDDAGLDGVGIASGLGRLTPQGGHGRRVLVGGEEEGDPAVADGRGPAPGGVAGAAEPQRDR